MDLGEDEPAVEVMGDVDVAGQVAMRKERILVDVIVEECVLEIENTAHDAANETMVQRLEMYMDWVAACY